MIKSQRILDDQYSMDKADQISGTIKALKPEWTTYLEANAAVSLIIPELSQMDISIWFGPMNETWGASVLSIEGDIDYAYLETSMDQDTDSVFALALMAVRTVEGWLAANRPQCEYGFGSSAYVRLASEIAQTVKAELLHMLACGDDENSIAGQISRARDDIKSFRDLHDYCDANTLGQQDRIQLGVAKLSGLTEGEAYVGACMQVQHDCQTEVDLWIQAGGLRVAKPVRCAPEQFSDEEIKATITKHSKVLRRAVACDELTEDQATLLMGAVQVGLEV